MFWSLASSYRAAVTSLAVGSMAFKTNSNMSSRTCLAATSARQRKSSTDEVKECFKNAFALKDRFSRRKALGQGLDRAIVHVVIDFTRIVSVESHYHLWKMSVSKVLNKGVQRGHGSCV